MLEECRPLAFFLEKSSYNLRWLHFPTL